MKLATKKRLGVDPSINTAKVVEDRHPINQLLN